MRNFAHIALAVAAACLPASPAFADPLPPSIGYTLYVNGARVGHSGMKITAQKNAVHFESRTQVQLGPDVIDLASRTEVDPVTFEVRRFSFEGTKGGMPVAAEVVIRGDSATGWVRTTASDEKRPRSRVGKGGFVVFEDWVMDLEVVLALRQAAAASDPGRYPLLFANSFLPSDVVTGFTGEVDVEAATRSMIARKLEIAMSGGEPFLSHVDPETGIPVYIHFPGSRTEAFRDDFFGENPVSRYPASQPGATAR